MPGSKDLKNAPEINLQKLQAAMEKQGLASSAKKDNALSKLRNNIRKSI